MWSTSVEPKGVYGGSWNKLSLHHFGCEEDDIDNFVIPFDLNSYTTVNITLN